MIEETLAKPGVLALDDPLRAPSSASTAATPRRLYVDVFRELLIAHMALAHASLMFNAARGEEELAARAPMPPADLLQCADSCSSVWMPSCWVCRVWLRDFTRSWC